MTAGRDFGGGAGTLFTPGPVMIDGDVRSVGGQPMVYHRTAAFSRRIENCERMLKEACGARPDDRVIMLTASGTGAMEAAVTNLFAPGEKVLVVNSGEFGRRFLEICEGHGCRTVEIALAPGRQIHSSHLAAVEAGGCAGLLVNHHETSTGGLLDLGLISRFCREHGLLLVVDAIGSFLADPLSVAGHGIDALIVSSQKALALPPGMSFVVLSGRGAERARLPRRRSYYFDFRKYLDDIARGQTPFTPAVGLILQLERRLERVLALGVADAIGGVEALALDFRRRIRGLPFRVFPECPSNAVTALEPADGTPPGHYVRRLAEAYEIFVCPNGGSLGERIFRVGHLGCLAIDDNARLVAALRAIGAGRQFLPSGEPRDAARRVAAGEKAI